MRYKKDMKAHKAGQHTADGFGSIRPYSVVVSIIEVFLRKNMGVRYYTWRIFGGGMVGLILMRFVIALPLIKPSLAQYVHLKLYYFDIFILAYLIMGIIQLVRQYRKGAIIHTDEIGDSRLNFIARALKVKNQDRLTFLVVEPLALILLILPISTYSLFLTLIFILGIFKLWYGNSTVMQRLRMEGHDLNDRKIEAGELQSTMSQIEQQKRSPTQKRSSQKKKPPTGYKVQPKRTVSPDVKTVLKRKNQRFHNPKNSKND